MTDTRSEGCRESLGTLWKNSSIGQRSGQWKVYVDEPRSRTFDFWNDEVLHQESSR